MDDGQVRRTGKRQAVGEENDVDIRNGVGRTGLKKTIQMMSALGR